jgi:hypothetical protein
MEKPIMETSDRTIIVVHEVLDPSIGRIFFFWFPLFLSCQEIEHQRRNVSTVASPRRSLIALYSHMDQQATP